MHIEETGSLPLACYNFLTAHAFSVPQGQVAGESLRHSQASPPVRIAYNTDP